MPMLQSQLLFIFIFQSIVFSFLFTQLSDLVMPVLKFPVIACLRKKNPTAKCNFVSALNDHDIISLNLSLSLHLAIQCDI